MAAAPTRPAPGPRPGTRTTAATLALAVLVLLLTGCTSSAGTVAGGRPLREATVRTLTGWVSLDTTLTYATGVADWTWTPTARTCDIVLNTPINAPASSANGSHTWVDEVHVNNQPARLSVTSTQVTATTGHCLPAGTPAHLEVRFRGHAGTGGNERVGHHGSVTWWGSAIPTPAHQDGHTWTRSDPVTTKGESVVSDVFEVHKLTILTPAGTQVLAPGRVDSAAATGGRRAWTVTTPEIRDLAFAAGHFATATAGTSDCRARGAVPAAAGTAAARRVALAAARSLAVLRRHFAFCPYATTTVIAAQPGYGGMEFPGLVVVSGQDPAAAPRLIAHEIGHQYFYAEVGNDQGRHPWLDEAFATYAEALVNPATARDLRARTYPAALVGRLGAPMSYWDAHPGAYSEGVYAQGATALLRARAAVGARRFDAALRDWIAACGLRVCGPGTLHHVLAKAAPAAVGILDAAGAWQ